MEYTLTFSESSKGFPSFYSFIPDTMVGMNNYFYTFKGGNIYRHNTNELHNNFYGTQYPSRIKSVFNDVPLENKLFKTINLEGDARWSATLMTDIQTTGYIESDWFEKKEGTFFAFVRNSGETPALEDEYVLRSVNGIGSALSVDNLSEQGAQYNFSQSPLVDIGSIVSIGDYLYFIDQGDNELKFGGPIIAINRQINLGVNYVITDSTDAGVIPTTQTPFVMYIKNAVAESHGVLGHYCVFELENNDTNKVELFAAEAEVMKSFP
jgi:hypothetical protein